eukprot:scaffold297931_cov27-Tisochrysis_lutea.AAC.1
MIHNTELSTNAHVKPTSEWIGRHVLYIDETLDLRRTLRTNLRKLSPKEFESLLHPIFQEDELTLIIVGSLLGLAVGYAQAEWDRRSKLNDPNYDARGRRIDNLGESSTAADIVAELEESTSMDDTLLGRSETDTTMLQDDEGGLENEGKFGQ